MAWFVCPGQALADARTLIWKKENLDLAKQLWEQGDPSIVPAVNHILNVSDGSISDGGYYSVTYKSNIPAGLTPHDYFTTCHYCWPNPDTEDGLPWIGIDGVSNPDSSLDGTQLQGLARDVQALSLSYYITGDQAYSDRAVDLIRVFFLNPDTYMKPEVRYGSAIPGVTHGRFSVAGVGNQFRRLFDPIALLEGSPSWTAADDAGMKQWASDFRNFMWNDPIGAFEQIHNDNHGTNYDMISALLSLYLDDGASAHEWILNYSDRIDQQFNPDGTQYYPLQRADSLLYHEYNLRIAMDIAEMAERFDDIYLWNQEAADGGSIANSIDFLIPYFTGQQPWDLWPSDATFAPKFTNWYRMWLRVAGGLDDPIYLTYADMTKVFDASGFDYDVHNIIYPVRASELRGDVDHDLSVGLSDLDAVLSNWNLKAGTPDPIPGDLDDSGHVGLGDLDMLLGEWGQTKPGPPPGDITGDLIVGLDDLDIVLLNWNQAVGPDAGHLGDTNGDGFVGLADLEFVLMHWGESTKDDILIGDLDGDGMVGLSDLDAMLSRWGEVEEITSSVHVDLNHDGFIGLDDLQLVLENWGEASASVYGVPEPSGLCLLAAGMLALNRRTG